MVELNFWYVVAILLFLNTLLFAYEIYTLKTVKLNCCPVGYLPACIPNTTQIQE